MDSLDNITSRDSGKPTYVACMYNEEATVVVRFGKSVSRSQVNLPDSCYYLSNGWIMTSKSCLCAFVCSSVHSVISAVILHPTSYMSTFSNHNAN